MVWTMQFVRSRVQKSFLKKIDQVPGLKNTYKTNLLQLTRKKFIDFIVADMDGMLRLRTDWNTVCQTQVFEAIHHLQGYSYICLYLPISLDLKQ